MTCAVRHEVILLGGFALVALLVDEPAAERVERLLRGGPTGITANNLAEVVDHLVRRRGVEEIHVRRLLEGLADSGFVVLHMSDETPWIAGRLPSRHHDRRPPFPGRLGALGDRRSVRRDRHRRWPAGSRRAS